MEAEEHHSHDQIQEIPPALQAPVVNAETIPDLIRSKNFKTRMAAYSKISLSPECLPLLQNETVVPAIESALDALLQYPGPVKTAHIHKFMPMIAHSKSTVKSKLDSLISKVYEIDQDAMYAALLELLENKNGKVIERATTKIAGIIENEDELAIQFSKGAAPYLKILFSQPDPSVKKAAVQLSVAIYKRIFKEIDQYLLGIKPMILKDLQVEFSQYDAPKKEVKASEYNFNDSNWKVRLAAMTALRDSAIDSSSFEILQIIQQRLKDVNIQVAIAAVETAKNGRVIHPEVVKLVIQRYKDRKAPLTKAVHEALVQISPGSSLLVEQLRNKNPEIKLGILAYLEAIKRTDSSANEQDILEQCSDEVALLMEDSNPNIRRAAASVLVDLPRLSDDKMKRICKLLNKPLDGPPNSKENAESNPKLAVESLKSSKASKEATEIPAKRNSASSANTEFQMASRLETDWRKRLEFLKENTSYFLSGPISTLCEMLGPKESNFNIIKQVLHIIADHPDISRNVNDILPLLFLRFTDTKLRSGIVQIFAKLPGTALATFYKENLEANRTGKKFIAMLEILMETLENQNEEVIYDFQKIICNIQPFGMKERAILSEAKAKLNKICISLSNSTAAGNAFAVKDNIAKSNNDSVEDATVCNNTVVRNHTKRDQGSRVNSGKEDSNVINFFRPEIREMIEPYPEKLNKTSKPCESVRISNSYISFKPCLSSANLSYKNVFTDGFLESLQKDPSPAMRLLEKADVRHISRAILPLFIDLALPSPYFNSLILHFITSKYILTENEASILTKHLLQNNMSDELEMLDRVYPATKLYAFYREMVMKGEAVNKSLKEIKRLLDGYIKGDNNPLSDAGISELLMKVNRNQDLIGLSLEYAKEEPAEAFSDCQDSFVVEEIVDCFQEATDKLKVPSILSSLPMSPKAVDGSVAIQTPVEHQNISLIEKSLENISISSTPIKKKRNCSLEQSDLSLGPALFNSITHSDKAISNRAISVLEQIALNDISLLIPYSNTAVGSLTIQLFDKYSDEELKTKILKTLLRVTHNEVFCKSLRFETLWSLNNDLLKISESEVLAVDILINICTGCSLDILRAYYDMLGPGNETIMKLIWTHSKRVNYESREMVTQIVRIIDRFYNDKNEMLSKADAMLLRVALSHLKRCCMLYSDGIKCAGGEILGRVVEVIVGGRDGSVEEIRKCFDTNY